VKWTWTERRGDDRVRDSDTYPLELLLELDDDELLELDDELLELELDDDELLEELELEFEDDELLEPFDEELEVEEDDEPDGLDELDELELWLAKPATSPPDVGVSLQARSGPIPAATTPPLRIRRN
jgi:hypothetical protein